MRGAIGFYSNKQMDPRPLEIVGMDPPLESWKTIVYFKITIGSPLQNKLRT